MPDKRDNMWPDSFTTKEVRRNEGTVESLRPIERIRFLEMIDKTLSLLPLILQTEVEDLEDAAPLSLQQRLDLLKTVALLNEVRSLHNAIQQSIGGDALSQCDALKAAARYLESMRGNPTPSNENYLAVLNTWEMMYYKLETTTVGEDPRQQVLEMFLPEEQTVAVEGIHPYVPTVEKPIESSVYELRADELHNYSSVLIPALRKLATQIEAATGDKNLASEMRITALNLSGSEVYPNEDPTKIASRQASALQKAVEQYITAYPEANAYEELSGTKILRLLYEQSKKQVRGVNNS